MTQHPALSRRTLGGLTVTTLSDGRLEAPITVLTGIDPKEAEALLAACSLPPAPVIGINAFLLQGDGRTVLIDTGGGAMVPTSGHLLSGLAAAGVGPEQVDLVLLTHLHRDHFGMLSRDGAAVFPNAELAFAEAEAAYWLDEANAAAAPEAKRPAFAAAVAAVTPYGTRTRLLSAGEVAPGISLVPLPGHTPGHSGFRIEGGGESLLIWGDLMHVPAVQSARPETGVIYDIDPAQAVETRKRVLDMVATDRTVVAGMHLDAPGFAQVTRAGSGYDLVPAG